MIGHVSAQMRKRRETILRPDALLQIIEAELPIRITGGRVTMIEHGQRQPSGIKIDAKSGKTRLDHGVIEVAQHDGALFLFVKLVRFFVAHHADAHALDFIEFIVERSRGFGCSIYFVSGAHMIQHRPVAWPAAHHHAGQDDCFTTARRLFHTLSHTQRRRGHHHLQAILNLFAAIVQQNVLRSSSHVDAQYLHVTLQPIVSPSLYLPFSHSIERWRDSENERLH